MDKKKKEKEKLWLVSVDVLDYRMSIVAMTR